MKRKVITFPSDSGLPPGIPSHIPQYSSAVRTGDYIFVSGQVGPIDEQGLVVEGTEAQTNQLLNNMKKILEAAGSSLDHVVKTTNYLVRAEDWDSMNRAYSRFFKKDWPARTTIIVAGLSKPDWLVEIECVAYCPQSNY